MKYFWNTFVCLNFLIKICIKHANSIVVIRAFKNLFESDWAEAVTALKRCIMF